MTTSNIDLQEIESLLAGCFSGVASQIRRFYKDWKMSKKLQDFPTHCQAASSLTALPMVMVGSGDLKGNFYGYAD